MVERGAWSVGREAWGVGRGAVQSFRFNAWHSVRNHLADSLAQRHQRREFGFWQEPNLLAKQQMSL